MEHQRITSHQVSPDEDILMMKVLWGNYLEKRYYKPTALPLFVCTLIILVQDVLG